jgi:hypothetical protein
MYKEIINTFFPELIINDYKLIVSGWESDVAIVNKELVFRFPKERNRFDCVYNKEKNITDKIKPYITTTIPIIKIFDTEPKKIFNFFKKQQKDWTKSFCKLDYIPSSDYEHSNKPNIADELAFFLKELHLVPVKIFKNIQLDATNLPFYKYKFKISNFKFDYDSLIPILKQYNLEQDFTNCLTNFSDFEWKDEDFVVCHNDLHMGNVMIDNNKLSGIIDFGDTIYTNYNVEFISILNWREEISLDIVKEYEKKSGRKINLKWICSVLKLQNYVKANNFKEKEKYINRIKYFDNLIK